jgi:hypothetical protein
MQRQGVEKVRARVWRHVNEVHQTPPTIWCIVVLECFYIVKFFINFHTNNILRSSDSSALSSHQVSTTFTNSIVLFLLRRTYR